MNQRKPTGVVVISLLIAGLMVACGDSDNYSDDDGGNNANNGGNNANNGGNNANNGGNNNQGDTLTFALENGGERPIWIQTSVAIGWPTWYGLTRGGEEVQPHSNCGVCQCGQDPCAICGAALPQAEAVLPGEAATFEWDRREWITEDSPGSPSGGICQRKIEASPGDYAVEFCWGKGIKSQGSEERITRERCETVQFSLDDGEVRHVVEETEALKPTDLVLENGGDESIYVQTAGDDCQGLPQWFSLADAEENRGLVVQEGCGMCACSEPEQCNNINCPGSCQVASVEEVPSGESFTFEWSGEVLMPSRIEAQTACTAHVPPPNDSLEVEFCWGSGVDNPDSPEQHITGEQCNSTAFTYGDVEARLVIGE